MNAPQFRKVQYQDISGMQPMDALRLVLDVQNEVTDGTQAVLRSIVDDQVIITFLVSDELPLRVQHGLGRLPVDVRIGQIRKMDGSGVGAAVNIGWTGSPTYVDIDEAYGLTAATRYKLTLVVR